MTDPYLAFASAVQALRRRTEALVCGFGGATGVAADPYPHQLATVSRILSDTRIRHLIADEVGLGKTVQALMIVNALRWQNPKHRTVVVVPDRLAEQWQSEIWTRAHLKAAVPGGEDEEERDEKPSIWIVRSQNIQDRSFRLSPMEHDLLIIDEPQVMTVEVMETILRNSDDFRQLLVLSATPRLGDRKSRDRLLRLLEPERFAVATAAGMEPDEYFEILEDKALELLDRDAGFAPSTAFATYSLERRIIRQTRADWGCYLPRRRVEKIEIEPLEGWRRAVELLQSVLRKNGEKNDLGHWPWTGARNVHKRRGAAKGVLVNVVKEEEASLAGQAMEIHEQIESDPGEVRLEALLDILSAQWSRNPEERFVIVAGDLPGIDQLAKNLPCYFPELGEKGAMVQFRQSNSVAETAFDSIVEMARLMEPFEKGEARVLLLGDWVQAGFAGLNLQHQTRNIIFYSLPWEHDSIDQLIGRIDRLRRNSLWKGDRYGHQGHVNIWYLVMRGTPEERVAQGFEALRLFDYPMPSISESETVLMTKRTMALARGRETEQVLEELKELGVEWHESEKNSLLESCSPFSPGKAREEYELWKAAPLPEPVLLSKGKDLPLVVHSEHAFYGWLRLMEQAGDFNIEFFRRDWEEENLTFWTFWYKTKGNKFHGVNIVAPFTLSCLEEENWRSSHAPFICHRRYMQAPPRERVHTDEGEGAPRLLRFLDHGDDLHDDLVKGYIQLGDEHFGNDRGNELVTVRLPGDHPALEYERQTILLTVSFSDPAAPFFKPAELAAMELAAIKQLIREATTDRQKAALRLDARGLRAMMRADERWLRLNFPARLDLHAASLVDHAWHDIDEEHVSALFRPLMRKKVEEKTIYPIARSAKQSSHISITDLKIGLTHYKRLTDRQGNEVWAARAMELEAEFAGRLEQISVEGEDLIDWRKRQLEQKRKNEPKQADREQHNMWRGQVEAAQRSLKMAELVLAARTNALKAAYKALSSGDISARHQWHMLVRFVSADE